METTRLEARPATRRGLAVVTGASSGLGAEFAMQLAKQGHSLLVVARRRDRLEDLASTLETNHGVSVEPLVADLSAPAEVERVAARLNNEPVELLVNNAGFGVVGRFFELDLAAQTRMVRVHIDATVTLTHAVLPDMIARDRGAVVNVSSLAAYAAVPDNAIYGATKAFLHSFTRGLELDLASRRSRVRVQVLCPGFTQTEFHADTPEQVERIPRWAWMSAGDVVAASLRGLERDHVIVVPGWRNKMVVTLLSLIPAWAKRRLGKRHARHARRR